MCAGILNRKNKSRHVPIMGTVLTWDIILILQIELSRGAVEKASKALQNPMMLNIHVSIAVSCVLLYIALIFTGRKLLQNNFAIRPLHKKLGWSAFVLRFLALITSFFAVVN